MFRQTLKITWYAMIHPTDTFNELKHRRYSDWGFVGAVTVLLFLSRVISRMLTGFRFNENNPDDFSIAIQLMSTAVPFLLFCVTNWCVCSIIDGEGKINEIFTFVSLALVPYIICQITATLISRVLVLEEKGLWLGIIIVGGLWSVMLLFHAIRIVHRFSSAKAVLTIFITIIGIAIILFVALLLVTMFQQVAAFISSVYSEILFRR